MLIYDKVLDTINVYKLTANPKDLRDYRINEMRNIPEDDRYFYAHNVGENMYSTPLFEQYRDSLDEIIFSREQADAKQELNVPHHYLNPVANRLTNPYYDGEYKDKIVARISYDQIKYFLLTESKYFDSVTDSREKLMGGILQIPESLYKLQLFEQEKYDILLSHGIDIREILGMYTLECIGELTLDELAKFDLCGVTENAHEKVLAKVKKDQRLVDLLRGN